MKKVFTILLCLLLAASLTIPAFADGSVSFSMSASGSTLSRGDTVTLSVSVSSSAEATSYGLRLTYDTSVFEVVGGECAASGALINSFNNGFAFLFQSPQAYSGSVGTVTLKVKDSAALGSYTVSGVAAVKNGSNAVDATGCSVSLTVDCDHSYGSWTQGEDEHQQTCSLCGSVNTQSHQWDEGTVTTAATCQDAGVMTYSCTVCGAAKTGEIPKTDEHSFSAPTSVDGNDHVAACSVCHQQVTEPHNWDSGTVTKPATCKETGVLTISCPDCGATKTETIPVTDTHNFGAWTNADSSSHKRTCSVCAKQETQKHNYGSAWSKDTAGHWHECTDCKNKKDYAAHTPGPEATPSTPQTCTICKYVIQAAQDHTHDYDQAWTTDENGHWHTCSGCEERGSYAVHDFEDPCDPDCSICGYARETVHTYDETWKADEKNHWRVCTGCGLIQDQQAHGEEPCAVCGYQAVPEETQAPETEPEEDDFDLGDDDEEENTTGSYDPDGSILWILLILGLLAGACGIVAFLKGRR